MKFYVAGKFEEWEKVRQVQDLVISKGHTVTFDWVEHAAIPILREGRDLGGPGFHRKCAEEDYFGVRTCNTVIALPHPEALGTIVEIGMAIAHNREVWLYGDWRYSVFWELPRVLRLRTEQELLDRLALHPR